MDDYTLCNSLNPKKILQTMACLAQLCSIHQQEMSQSNYDPFPYKLINLSPSLPFLLSPIYNHYLPFLSYPAVPSSKVLHACSHL